MRNTVSVAVIIAALATFGATSEPAHAATDGINRLIAVTQMKSNNANDAAMDAANKQKDLLNRQKALRAQQPTLTEKTRTSPLVCYTCRSR